MVNNIEVPQNIKSRTTIWSSYPILGLYPKEKQTVYWSYIYIQTSLCSIIHSSQNMETICLSVNGWMDKESVHINTVKYYSAVKMKKS